MNNEQAYFKESDIPYNDLLKIGITKMDVLTLDKSNLEALTTGNRTKILDLEGVDNNGNSFKLKGKISLYWKEDNTAGVNIHPVRKEILNDINLKPQELDSLKSNEIILKTINKEKYLVQLDNETNEILKAKVKDIIIPTYIKDQKISTDEKEQLKSGKEVTLNTEDGKLNIRIDLNNPRGFRMSDAEFAQKQKIAYDYHNPQIIGTIPTDKNTAEYLEYMKKNEAPLLGNELKNKNSIKF